MNCFALNPLPLNVMTFFCEQIELPVAPKGSMLARYFKNATVCPSFMRLRFVRPKIEFIKYQNRKYVTKIQFYLLI